MSLEESVRELMKIANAGDIETDAIMRMEEVFDRYIASETELSPVDARMKLFNSFLKEMLDATLGRSSPALSPHASALQLLTQKYEELMRSAPSRSEP